MIAIRWHLARLSISCRKDQFDAIVLTDPENLVYLRSAISCNPNLRLPEVYAISSTGILPANDLN